MVSQGATWPSVVQRLPDSLQSFVSSAVIQLNNAYLQLPDPLRLYIDTAVRQARLDSPSGLLASSLILLTAVLSMSGWGSRLYDRFSPFGSRPNVPNITEDDYSYIRSTDLEEPQRSYDPVRARSTSSQPADDILLLRHKGIIHQLRFPAYSIGDGKLQVRDVRARAAEELGISPTRPMKLLYKGQALKDDYMPCCEYSLKNQSEILCLLAEDTAESGSDDASDSVATDGKAKRKRARKPKKKKNTLDPSVTPPSGASASNSRVPSPAPPKSAMDKLQDISTRFRTEILPACVQYTASPPADPKKKAFEHGKLTEAILTEIMKLDGVTTDDPEAREKRKALVKEFQRVMAGLDDSVAQS